MKKSLIIQIILILFTSCVNEYKINPERDISKDPTFGLGQLKFDLTDCQIDSLRRIQREIPTSQLLDALGIEEMDFILKEREMQRLDSSITKIHIDRTLKISDKVFNGVLAKHAADTFPAIQIVPDYLSNAILLSVAELSQADYLSKLKDPPAFLDHDTPYIIIRMTDGNVYKGMAVNNRMSVLLFRLLKHAKNQMNYGDYVEVYTEVINVEYLSYDEHFYLDSLINRYK